jgi:hypothetical protein
MPIGNGNTQQLNSIQVEPSAVASFSPPHAASRQSRVDELYSPEYFGGLEDLAGKAAASRLFGDSTREQLFMVLMTGRELGISPTVALRNIGVFKGKTVISSQLQLAKVKEAGYLAEILENTDERATVRIQKLPAPPYQKTFTMADAQRAGLVDRNAVYKTMPSTMLLNRAIGLVTRYGAPEVLNGLYNETELLEMDDPLADSASHGQSRPVQTLTPASAPADGGWGLSALEEFADLMDSVYTAFKAHGRQEMWAEFEARWKANKAKDPSSVVLPRLRDFYAKLAAAVTPASTVTTAPVEVEAPVITAEVVENFTYGPGLTEKQIGSAKGHGDRLKLDRDGVRRVVSSFSFADKQDTRKFMDILMSSKDDVKIREAFERHPAFALFAQAPAPSSPAAVGTEEEFPFED